MARNKVKEEAACPAAGHHVPAGAGGGGGIRCAWRGRLAGAALVLGHRHPAVAYLLAISAVFGVLLAV